MKLNDLLKLWMTLEDKDKNKFIGEMQHRLSRTLGEATRMCEEGELNSSAFKKVMDEFVSQNPLYGLFLQDKL